MRITMANQDNQIEKMWRRLREWDRWYERNSLHMERMQETMGNHEEPLEQLSYRMHQWNRWWQQHG